MLFSKGVRAPYGAGTLMTVLTIVAPATRTSALPSSRVKMTAPAVENVIVAFDTMVPTMLEPVLIVAPAGTYQQTFLACAPLTSWTVRGTVSVGPVGVLTSSVESTWNTQTAPGFPAASRVRSPVVIW